ncbi:MAG TPA: hypothetical protein DDW77_02010 [Verrucomicrobiales bacterium]|nr:hypothetical protein [Verrucomicrobiales bacterium]
MGDGTARKNSEKVVSKKLLVNSVSLLEKTCPSRPPSAAPPFLARPTPSPGLASAPAPGAGGGGGGGGAPPDDGAAGTSGAEAACDSSTIGGMQAKRIGPKTGKMAETPQTTATGRDMNWAM